MGKHSIAIGLFTGLSVISLLSGCKVIDTGTESRYTGDTEFNAADSAAGIWEQAEEEISANAADLSSLLNEGDQDLRNEELIARYKGRDLSTTKNAAANAVVYAVKGSGTVVEIDSKSVSEEGSTMGTITVKLDGYNGGDTVEISVGPKLKKTNTALRDYLSFVALGQGDYGDTVKWAELSASLNDTAVTQVVGQIDLTLIEGKKITFTGAFATDSVHPDELVITPVRLTVE